MTDEDTGAVAIKATAVRAGFCANNYGTHSARVGGACTLRAGGASDSMIELLGRWKNIRTALSYTESGMREFDLMQNVLRDPTIFTNNDVRLLHERPESFHEKVRGGHAGAPTDSSRKSVNFANY